MNQKKLCRWSVPPQWHTKLWQIKMKSSRRKTQVFVAPKRVAETCSAQCLKKLSLKHALVRFEAYKWQFATQPKVKL